MIGVRRDDHQDAEQQAVGERFVHGRSFSIPSLAVRVPAGRPKLIEGRRACSENSPPRPPAPLPPAGEGSANASRGQGIGARLKYSALPFLSSTVLTMFGLRIAASSRIR